MSEACLAATIRELQYNVSSLIQTINERNRELTEMRREYDKIKAEVEALRNVQLLPRDVETGRTFHSVNEYNWWSAKMKNGI